MKVKINPTMCKGCSYCINFCPKKIIEMGTQRNKKGHFYPAVTEPDSCITCGICATVCPEGAIEIVEEGEC